MSDYADDIAILANAPAQAETLLLSLERAAAGIGLHANAHKMEYMCFNQTSDISTLNGSSLKLVDKFTYLGSSVSSTETDINTRGNTPQSSSCTATYYPSRKLSKFDEPNMLDTAGEVGTSS